MRSRLGLALACVLALPGQSCRRTSSDASGSGAALGGAASTASGSAAAAHAGELERARQLCHALQGGPAERRAACCGGRPSGHVESSCVRDLSLALAEGRVALDAPQIESCTLASARALEGCDWVTPGQPMPPAECQGLVTGRVALGGVCRSSLECEGQLHCEGGSPTQAGRCAAPKPPPAACAPAADGLATYLFVRDLERTHPTCTGTCSLITHRCEASSATSNPAAPGASATHSSASSVAPAAGEQHGRGSKRTGESCQTDFDCSQGGCNGNPGTCGMKCAISLADQARFKDMSPLSLPSKPTPASTETQRQRPKTTSK